MIWAVLELFRLKINATATEILESAPCGGEETKGDEGVINYDDGTRERRRVLAASQSHMWTGSKKRTKRTDALRVLVEMICSFFLSSWTGVVIYHRPRPSIRPKQDLCKAQYWRASYIWFHRSEVMLGYFLAASRQDSKSKPSN
ncbi:unnamed protein product [Thlaspi arvense]|uniref:Uncharacterized protein n=1 Tax=Thlaspi arvense TaxID=13288 RepID=A0AAU9STU6_THLAR|nr:unnamed protein product [Thlaspi arvense]